MIYFLHNIIFSVSSGAAGDSGLSIKDIVLEELADHVIDKGIIAKINSFYLNKKLFGIFDLRITGNVLMMWISAILCILIFIPVARGIKKSLRGSNSRWINLWEMFISFVKDQIVEPNFGPRNTGGVLPYFLNLFYFILFCNLLGIIPYLRTPTGNLAITAGLSLLTFSGMLGAGIKKHGLAGFFISMAPGGVPKFLYILIIPIELIGLLIKPFALAIRLFANMTAGHIVIIIFLYLVIFFQNYLVGVGSVFGALMINLLELLVAFIQAYIFTFLSAMFISSSMQSH